MKVSLLKILIKNNLNTQGITIGILGASYKENTNDLRNSLSLKLAKELDLYGFHCRLHDPMKDESVIKKQSVALEELSSFHDLSVIIITVGHDDYRKMGLNKLLKMGKKPCIVMDIPNLFANECNQIEGLIYWNL